MLDDARRRQAGPQPPALEPARLLAVARQVRRTARARLECAAVTARGGGLFRAVRRTALALFAFACGWDREHGVPRETGTRTRRVERPERGAHAAARGLRRYVSPRGSDGNPGTLRRPWRTIQHGLDRLRKGQALLVRRGTYRENLVADSRRHSQAADDRAELSARASGALPGDTDENSMPLQVGTGAAYLRFSGLVFQGARGPSTTNVYVMGVRAPPQFSRCEVRNSARQGFFSSRRRSRSGSSGCDFHDNGGSGPEDQDHNIYMEGETRDREPVLRRTERLRHPALSVEQPCSDREQHDHGQSFRDHRRRAGEPSVDQSPGREQHRRLQRERRPITTFWGEGSRGTGNFAANNLG